jgi:hypothetical protein
VKTPLLFAVALACITTRVLAQTPESTPTAIDPQRASGVDRRGDQAMGFRHGVTSHHFHLLKDGGAIEVEAADPTDTASKAAIRGHLERVAGMFAQGNFSLPMFIHDTVPPGVEVMQRLKGQITYTAENTAQGAQVRIATSNPAALTAVHEFLRFQIQDHRTGDPLAVPSNP